MGGGGGGGGFPKNPSVWKLYLPPPSVNVNEKLYPPFQLEIKKCIHPLENSLVRQII